MVRKLLHIRFKPLTVFCIEYFTMLSYIQSYIQELLATFHDKSTSQQHNGHLSSNDADDVTTHARDTHKLDKSMTNNSIQVNMIKLKSIHVHALL